MAAPTPLLLLLLLLRGCLAVVELHALFLGDGDVADLVRTSVTPLLLSPLTNATHVDAGPFEVDTLVGRAAQSYFPNASLFSFALVYVTRARFTLTTPDDDAAARGLRCCLVARHVSGRALAVESVATANPASDWFTKAWIEPWPSYVAIIAYVGWVATLLVLGCYCATRRGNKGAIPAAVFTATLSSATPSRPDPREKLLRLPGLGTRR